ncbi:MAG: hypothetical protein Q7T71_04215, partial [Herbiconiux sp.]|nr:hypothetical protein [Herbiconiux sp.]
MVPVDYSDAPGDPAAPAAREAELRASVGLFADLSSSRFQSTVVFPTATPRWLRMPHTKAYYMEAGQYEQLNDALGLARTQMGETAFAAADFAGVFYSGEFRGSEIDVRFVPNGAGLEGGWVLPITSSK